MKILGTIILFILFLCGSVLSAAAIELTDDLTPPQEIRYRALAEELRCLVCQNQSLADSDSDLASDMRAVVRRMIKAGNSNDEIKQFMTERYGDFVLYRPPFNAATLLLWLFPFVVLVLGFFTVYGMARRRRIQLSAADKQRARALLDEVGEAQESQSPPPPL